MAAGARAWVLTGGLRGHVEPRTPHGVAAVARIPPAASDAGRDLVLVLAGVSDPGNLGTLLRTAEAVDAAVVLTEGSVDPWSPKVVRASAGSVLRVPVATRPAPEALDALAAAGLALVGTRSRGGARPEALDLRAPVALVLGGEAHGLPAEVEERIERWATLPMVGRVESLNVAVAGSVLAFEAVRQRATPTPG